MAINKKLIHFDSKAAFTSNANNAQGIKTTNLVTTPDSNGNVGNIPYRSIVFIKDSGEIWTHGKYYSNSLPHNPSYLTNANTLNSGEWPSAKFISYISNGSSPYGNYPTSAGSALRMIRSTGSDGYTLSVWELYASLTENELWFRNSVGGTTWATWYKVLHSGNSSVSLSGSTLTVKINGTEKSLTNTWRGIQNNLTSDSTTDSLSAAQGKILNNKFSNYLPLLGGTLDGALTVKSSIFLITKSDNSLAEPNQDLSITSFGMKSDSDTIKSWKFYSYQGTDDSPAGIGYMPIVFGSAYPTDGGLFFTGNKSYSGTTNSNYWGIDTDDPLYTLDVNGDIGANNFYASGNVYANSKKVATEEWVGSRGYLTSHQSLSEWNTHLSSAGNICGIRSANNYLIGENNISAATDANVSISTHYSGAYFIGDINNSAMETLNYPTLYGSALRMYRANSSTSSSSDKALQIVWELYSSENDEIWMRSSHCNYRDASHIQFNKENWSKILSVFNNSITTINSSWLNNNAGKFYLGDTNPTKNTRLNYNGNLYATKLYSGGSEVLTSHLDLSNYVTLDGNQTITGQKTFTKDIILEKNIILENSKYIYGKDTDGNQYLLAGLNQNNVFLLGWLAQNRPDYATAIYGSTITLYTTKHSGESYTNPHTFKIRNDGTFTYDDHNIYHAGNLSISTLIGSTAIGDSDEPVYWSGNAFVKANAYPTKASWNYDDVYLKDVLLDTGNATDKNKSASLTNGNVYLKLFKTVNGAESEDSKIKIYGDTNVTVTTNSNGDIKITGVDSVSTATNLANAPSLQAGTSDTKKVTVTAGGKTSDEYTIPYATNADTIDSYHETAFFRYRGELYQNHDYNADTLGIGSWIFRDSVYGNVGTGAAHTNALNSNSTIEVFSNLQLSTTAWQDAVCYRVRWGRETRPADRPNGWSAWQTFLSSANYTNYTVKKDGTGATGTWGISITGDATSASKLQNTSAIGSTSQPVYFTANGVPSEINLLKLSFSDTTNLEISASNSNGKVGIYVSQNRGLYDFTKSSWIIYRGRNSLSTYISDWASIGDSANPIYINSSGRAAATSYTFTSTTPSSSSTDATVPTSKAVWSAVNAGFIANDAMVFKGTFGSNNTLLNGNKNASPSLAYLAGWTYRINADGYINTSGAFTTSSANSWQRVEIGDLLIAIFDSGSSLTAVNTEHWTIIQTNIVTLDYLTTSNYTDYTYGKSNLYTRTESDNRYVNVTGDTITGSLLVNNYLQFQTYPGEGYTESGHENDTTNIYYSLKNNWIRFETADLNVAGNKVAHEGNISQSATPVSVTWNTETTIATIAGVDIKIKIPANPNSNTATAANNILQGSNSGTQITYAPYSSATATSTWVGNNNNAGKLYSGTLNPSKDTRLNYNGNLYATKLYSGGKLVLTSHQDLSNYVTLNDDQTITGLKTFNSTVTFNNGIQLMTRSDSSLDNPNLDLTISSFWYRNKGEDSLGHQLPDLYENHDVKAWHIYSYQRESDSPAGVGSFPMTFGCAYPNDGALSFTGNKDYSGTTYNNYWGINTDDPLYRLHVNGTFGANTIYENGTSLSEKYLPLSAANVTTKMVLANNTNSTTDISAATDNTNTFINLIEGETVTKSLKITGSGGTSVAGSADSKTITISSTSPTSCYWANILITSSAAYNKTPEFGSITIGNGTTSSGTKKCQLIYDSTNQCLKFVFV